MAIGTYYHFRAPARWASALLGESDNPPDAKQYREMLAREHGRVVVSIAQAGYTADRQYDYLALEG